MKKHISPCTSALSVRAPFIILFAALLLSLVTPLAARAQEDGPGKPRVSVQHARAIDGLPVFEVSVERQDEEPLELSISDESGIVLYSARIRSANYSKRFQIEIPGEENVKLFLKVDNRKSKETQTYLISSKVSRVEDLVVSRL